MVGEQKVGRFSFHANVPQEIRPVILKALYRSMELVPNWCERIHIRWASCDEVGLGSSTIAFTETHYDYRYAVITICPAFHHEDDESRANYLRHELLHVFWAPLYIFCRAVVRAVYPGEEEEEPAKKLIMEQLREKYEGATQDLATAIGKLQAKTIATADRQKNSGTH